VEKMTGIVLTRMLHASISPHVHSWKLALLSL
jgi:hypothetical protein